MTNYYMYCIVLYFIVLYLYIYIALLAVHTNQKRFQCERPREKRAVLIERNEALGSPINKVEGKLLQFHLRWSPGVRMEKLRRVHRAAARLIGGFRKFDHISDYMRDVLHWLPFTQRISYRIASLVWRACLAGRPPICASSAALSPPKSALEFFPI